MISQDDIHPGNAEYERNRIYMTNEASAAVRGILTYEPEATVVVCDAHVQFANLIPDRLARLHAPSWITTRPQHVDRDR